MFVIADVNGVISRIESAQQEMDEATLAALKKNAATNQAALTEGLESWDVLDKLNRLARFGKKATGTVQAVANPLGTLSSIFLSELLDDTLSRRWQRVFERAGAQHADEHARRIAA